MRCCSVSLYVRVSTTKTVLTRKIPDMRITLPVPLVVLLLAAALILPGCGSLPGGATPDASATMPMPAQTGNGAITNAAELVGVWQVYDPHCTPGYMLIRSDGTYTWSCQPDGSNGLTGKYHFSNGNFVVLNDFCGAEGRYNVNIASDNPKALAFSVVNDSCNAEIQTLTGQKVTWVSPLP